MLLATEIITPSQVYWITRLDDIQRLLEVGCFVGGMAYVIVSFAVLGALDESYTTAFRRLCVFVALVVGAILPFCAVARALTPSTKDMLLIYGVPAIVNNEKVQQKAADALDGTEDLLKLAKSYVAEKLSVEDKPSTKKDDTNAPGR